jgi:hypothetical protein
MTKRKKHCQVSKRKSPGLPGHAMGSFRDTQCKQPRRQRELETRNASSRIPVAVWRIAYLGVPS